MDKTSNVGAFWRLFILKVNTQESSHDWSRGQEGNKKLICYNKINHIHHSSNKVYLPKGATTSVKFTNCTFYPFSIILRRLNLAEPYYQTISGKEPNEVRIHQNQDKNISQKNEVLPWLVSLAWFSLHRQEHGVP